MATFSKKFRFRQFELSHRRSTMKIGTDAVVLGAWLDVSTTEKILEIGTGCGIIALMLAQKSSAQLVAIDVDADSACEAHENFECSPWCGQLKSVNSPVQDFEKDKTGIYDLIVSNPPFFQNSLLPPTEKRQLARHNTNLIFEEFLFHSARLLAYDGRLSVILPTTEEAKFVSAAAKERLFLSGKLEIFPKPSKQKKRVILVFSFQKIENPQIDSLILRNENGTYSNHYKEITKEFHTDF